MKGLSVVGVAWAGESSEQVERNVVGQQMMRKLYHQNWITGADMTWSLTGERVWGLSILPDSKVPIPSTSWYSGFFVVIFKSVKNTLISHTKMDIFRSQSWIIILSCPTINFYSWSIV